MKPILRAAPRLPCNEPATGKGAAKLHAASPHAQLNPKKPQFNKVAELIFQESPKSYDEGKPPVFRVEYISENDLEAALKILQTVRFYES